MTKRILNKIVKLISSDDEEMRELGRTLFIQSKPGVADYLYMEEAVRLAQIDSEAFIASVERRIRSGYDILQGYNAGSSYTAIGGPIKMPGISATGTFKPTP